MTVQLRTLTLLALAIIFTSSAQIRAEDDRDLQPSRWDSVYTTPGGTEIGARLTLNGNRGQYITRGGARGRLLDVSYDSQPDRQVVSGRWRFQNGQTGDFQLYVTGDQFYGIWRDEGPRGTEHPWSGTRVGAKDLAWVGKPGIEDAGTEWGTTQAVRLPGDRLFVLTFDRRNGQVLRQEIRRIDE